MTRKLFSLAAVLLAAQVLLGVAAYPQAVYTDAQAKQYAKEVLPVVEKITGRKFTSVPVVTTSTAPGRLPILQRQSLSDVYVLYPELTNDQIRKAEEESGKDAALLVLGAYNPESKRVELFPNNLQPRMALGEVEPKYFQQIAKLVVAHELTHALQDQMTNLQERQMPRFQQQDSYANRAAIEGHATYIMGRVADELGTSEAFRQFLRSIGLSWVKSTDPASEIVLQPMRKLISYSYVSGRDFMAWQQSHGGTEQVWNAVLQPPAEMSMIFHPETYSPKPQQAPDYSSVLKGLDQRFGITNAVPRSFTLDYAVLRAVYESLGQKQASTVTDNVLTTRSLLVLGRKERASVTLYVLKSASSAPSVISAMQELDQRNLDAVRKSTSAKTTPPAVRKFTVIASGTATKTAFASSTATDLTGVTLVRAAKGTTIVEVSAVGVQLTDKEIGSIIDEVLARAALPPAAKTGTASTRTFLAGASTGRR